MNKYKAWQARSIICVLKGFTLQTCAVNVKQDDIHLPCTEASSRCRLSGVPKLHSLLSCLSRGTKSSSETGPGSETRVQKLQFRSYGSETDFVVFRNWFGRIPQLLFSGSDILFVGFRNYFLWFQKLVLSVSETIGSDQTALHQFRDPVSFSLRAH